MGNGWCIEDVVNILLLDEETLRRYVKQYQKGGLDELVADSYKGSYGKLSSQQLEELNLDLEKNTYLTVEAIVDYVEKKYEISYTVSGMTDLLHRLDFTYKKSKLVPAKADSEKQKSF